MLYYVIFGDIIIPFLSSITVSPFPLLWPVHFTEDYRLHLPGIWPPRLVLYCQRRLNPWRGSYHWGDSRGNTDSSPHNPPGPPPWCSCRMWAQSRYNAALRHNGTVAPRRTASFPTAFLCCRWSHVCPLSACSTLASPPWIRKYITMECCTSIHRTTKKYTSTLS